MIPKSQWIAVRMLISERPLHRNADSDDVAQVKRDIAAQGFPALCINDHYCLTGLTISPRVFVLCSQRRAVHVPAFPPIGGGAVA